MVFIAGFWIVSNFEFAFKDIRFSPSGGRNRSRQDGWPLGPSLSPVTVVAVAAAAPI